LVLALFETFVSYITKGNDKKQPIDRLDKISENVICYHEISYIIL